VWEHLTAEGSPEVADDDLAAALRLLGGVDAQHHLAGDRLRGALRLREQGHGSHEEGAGAAINVVPRGLLGRSAINAAGTRAHLAA
jgi:hypothetical protein